VAPADIGRQLLAEHSELISLGRAHMAREISGTTVTSHWNEKHELGKAGRGEPGESAAVVRAAQRHAPVTVDAVPTEVCRVEGFAAHRLDGISKECGNFANLTYSSLGQDRFHHTIALLVRIPSIYDMLDPPAGACIYLAMSSPGVKPPLGARTKKSTVGSGASAGYMVSTYLATTTSGQRSLNRCPTVAECD
jgi:hypothetical protein